MTFAPVGHCKTMGPLSPMRWRVLWYLFTICLNHTCSRFQSMYATSPFLQGIYTTSSKLVLYPISCSEDIQRFFFQFLPLKTVLFVKTRITHRGSCLCDIDIASHPL